MQQVESHHSVAYIEQPQVDGVVGGRAGEGLHVDVDLVGTEAVGGEGFRGAPAGKSLGHIRIFHALVVARVAVAAVFSKTRRVVQNFLLGHPARLLLGIAFGVDVLERRAKCFTSCKRGGRFTGDQDQLAGLPLGFELGQLIDIGIELGEVTAK